MATLVVSYSRIDRTQVRAVVALLKAALRGIDYAVFWDEDFEPGDPWFEQICRHIDGAPQLLVFWCEHAAGSEQVRREFSYAIQRGKRVVPVLMDNTALIPELAPIHGIDLRDALQHASVSRPAPPAPPNMAPAAWESTPRPRPYAPPASSRPSPRRPAAARLGVIAALAVLGIAGSLFWTLGRSGRPDALPPAPSVQTPPSDPSPADPAVRPRPTALPSSALVSAGVIIASVVVGGVALLLVLRRQSRRRSPLAPHPPPTPSELPSLARERIIAAFHPFLPDPP